MALEKHVKFALNQHHFPGCCIFFSTKSAITVIYFMTPKNLVHGKDMVKLSKSLHFTPIIIQL